jgi:drug/metabolite transporter (DMT)-like permease
MVGIIMLTEAVLGPIWAWLFVNEQPPFIVLIGGSIVIFAVLLQFYNLYTADKKQINTN